MVQSDADSAVISIISWCDLSCFIRWNDANHYSFNYQQYHHPQITPKQLPPFPRLTTPLPLRGGAEGEALFPSHYFIFNYQPRHPHNCFISQLGTSCSFDSPGLARNAPTPGKHSQGDSTPSVLSFFYEGMVITKLFMADNAEKAQHLRRCSTQTIR